MEKRSQPEPITKTIEMENGAQASRFFHATILSHVFRPRAGRSPISKEQIAGDRKLFPAIYAAKTAFVRT
jgi:hypothetical protein